MAESYRALIVDDEPSVRSLTVRAMRQEQIICDEAADGDQADALCQRERYDLVVTDLQMPRRNGYSLACALLDRDDRPLIVVLTGVLEPRLAKDMYARGVDHIEFKPVNYDLLATKLKSLLTRQVRNAVPSGSRNVRGMVAQHGPSPGNGSDPGRAVPEGMVAQHGAIQRAESRVTCDHATAQSRSALPAITIGEVEQRLQKLAGILPMSQAALDVVDVVQADDSNATQAAAAIARDASLAVEVLKLANSSFYNPSAQQVVSLEQAVVRIGTRRVGELAMAATVLTSLTTGVLPWMDVDLAWRRSIAAGLAVDWLVDSADLGEHHEGLFLCALLHGLGRIALGTMFTGEYESMVTRCRESNSVLLHLEHEVFPESTVETMIRLLSFWNVPTSQCEPLRHLFDEYTALSRLDEVSRRKVELLKLSVLIGQMAVGQWEPWDLIELPPASVLARLNVTSVRELVERTRADLFEVIHFRKRAIQSDAGRTKPNKSEWPLLCYDGPMQQGLDFLPEILRCLNIVTVSPESTATGAEQPILFNRLGAGAEELVAALKASAMATGQRLLVADLDGPAPQHPQARMLRLPCSFAALQSDLQWLLQRARS